MGQHGKGRGRDTFGMWPLKYHMAALLPDKIKAQAFKSTLDFSS